MTERLPGRVTLEDVARVAGVSRATASRALGGYGAASAAVRQRVATAARRLNYVPDSTARALATGDGMRIAVVVCGPTATVLRDPYVGRVVAAAAEVGVPHQVGVSLQWLPVDDVSGLHRLATDRTLYGAILVNTTGPALAAVPPALHGRIASIGIGSAAVPSFDVDNGIGTSLVIKHLLAAGRRRVAMVTGPAWLPCGQRAVDSYQQAVEAAGLPVRTVPGDFTAARGRAAAVEVIARWPDTDAMFVLGDLAALGALAALRGAGVDVPGDVAVAGFDDIPFATLSEPALTTASHPVESIATRAATAVLERLAPPPVTLFASSLVRRQSA